MDFRYAVHTGVLQILGGVAVESIQILLKQLLKYTRNVSAL
jgi:hypothetical protein